MTAHASHARSRLLQMLRSGVAVAASFACATAIAQPASPSTPSVVKAAVPLVRSAERPNMIVIMGDDIGYSDIGAFGGEIDTPNLDELARHSLKFSNFYNMSRCCPSRASLLTGRYPHRVNMGENGNSLAKDVPTVAEELRDAGYATTMIGKWHLTAAVPLKERTEQLKWLNHQAYRDRDFGDRTTYPAARGFEHHWGTIWGIDDYYDPFSLVDDFTPVQTVPKGFYLTDAISDHAVSEVRRLGGGTQPFMMYVAYTAAHWPLMAPEKVIQKYLPRYADGWERLRADRYARQISLGLIDPATNQVPALDKGYENNAGIAWSNLTAAERAVQVRKMATHAAMIDVMDQGIGRLIKALKDSGQYEKTVIMFLNDNGASPEIMTYADYDRWSETRDGRRVQYGEYPEVAAIGGETTMATIGSYWASAANTPFRWWKAEAYQGGTHTPFMMSWPGHMGSREGMTVADAAHVVDVTPTLLALAHVTPRASRAPVDGVSLDGALKGRAVARQRPLFFEHEGSRAVIDGQWKLVARAPGPSSPVYRAWELYDLGNDRTETTDVAAQNAAVVRRLEGLWDGWAREVGVRARIETARSFQSD
ncbi:arylsulfatase [Sphingomonas yunnanensis]|uniref:arylsulfatase n=1 Tax=Sphingomonas yunnanensis TaxID=310400 RepID=UPI001CA66B92|nr:arylsulfatase [Sphingomonas yunnanensis]MBY9063599.1 arylsulfatase [Sphingomonas yunnanensis]